MIVNLLLVGCVQDDPLPVIPREEAPSASGTATPASGGGGPTADVETTNEQRVLDGDAPRGNSAPRISGVRATPAEPTTTTDITVQATVEDPDGDFVRTSYRWEVNGRKIMGNRRDTLPSREFQKGDVVTCTVVADDTYVESTSSFDIEVVNAPPAIVSIPGIITSVDGLQVQARDPDGDPLRWSLEGAPYGMAINERTGEIQYKGSKAAGDGAFSVTVVVTDPEDAEARWNFQAEVAAGKTDEQAEMEGRLKQLEAQTKAQEQSAAEPPPTFRDAKRLNQPEADNGATADQPPIFRDAKDM